MSEAMKDKLTDIAATVNSLPPEDVAYLAGYAQGMAHMAERDTHRKENSCINDTAE